MKYFFILFLALLTISCASSMKIYHIGRYTYTNNAYYTGKPLKIIPIWVDKTFGNADKLAIDDAINQWNYTLNGYIVLRVVDYNFDMEVSKIEEQRRKSGWLILKVDHTNSAIHDDPGRITLGTGNSDNGDLYIVRERLKNEDVFGITLHEMGHLLSDPYHIDEEGLMYGSYSQGRYQCVDYNSMVKIAKFQNLPITKLNYCDN